MDFADRSDEIIDDSRCQQSQGDKIYDLITFATILRLERL